MFAKLLMLRRQLAVKRYPREKLEALRNRRLQATIQWAYDTVPYYRNLFDSLHISPADIRTPPGS